MIKIKLELPVDFDIEAPIFESKGWMLARFTIEDGRDYTICFCCPTRLQQDVSAELETQPCYLQRNLIIIPAVTKEWMARAVTWLSQGDALSNLVPDE